MLKISPPARTRCGMREFVPAASSSSYRDFVADYNKRLRLQKDERERSVGTGGGGSVASKVLDRLAVGLAVGLHAGDASCHWRAPGVSAWHQGATRVRPHTAGCQVGICCFGVVGAWGGMTL